MKVRAVQFSPVLGDIKANLDFHAGSVKKAVEDGMDLIVFPELSLSGYQLKDIVYDVALQPEGETIRILRELSRDIDVVAGAPVEVSPGLIQNCALYFSGGKTLHCHSKVQLPNFGMFEEQMIFQPGLEFRTFQVRDVTVGMLICREILFPIHAYLYHLQKADMVIAISNSPFRGLGRENFSSYKLWENLGYTYSMFFHQNYVFVNRTGFEDGIGFGGGSFFAPAGTGIKKQAAYLDPETADFEFNMQDVAMARLKGNYLRDEHPELILREMKRIADA